MITLYMILFVALAFIAKKDIKRALRIGSVGIFGVFMIQLLSIDVRSIPEVEIMISLLIGTIFIILTLRVIR